MVLRAANVWKPRGHSRWHCNAPRKIGHFVLGPVPKQDQVILPAVQWQGQVPAVQQKKRSPC